MDENSWDFLYEVNCSEVEETKERFLNDINFYAECVKKCLNDPAFASLKEYLINRNTKEAFEASHSLKGICANCGLTSLYNILIKIVEPLRAGEIEGLFPFYNNLENELKKTRKTAEQYFGL